MKCPHCGFENEDGALFCINCGMAMKTQEEIDEDKRRREEEQKKREEEEERRKLEKLKEQIREEEQQREAARRKADQDRYEAQLKKKEDTITQLNYQLRSVRTEADTGKKKVIAMSVVAILLLGFLSIWSYQKYSDVNSRYQNYRRNTEDMVEENKELDKKNQELDKENQALSKEIDQLRSFLPEDVFVSVLGVYNADAEGKKLDGGLKSDEMRYLFIKYHVSAVDPEFSEPVDIYIDIYKPNGELWKFSKSPDNHTSPAQEVKPGKTDTWGLGNDTASLYTSGKYRIDLVYNGEIVGSRIVNIK